MLALLLLLLPPLLLIPWVGICKSIILSAGMSHVPSRNYLFGLNITVIGLPWVLYTSGFKRLTVLNDFHIVNGLLLAGAAVTC